MADYRELALVDDPDALLELGVEYLESSIDGFEARPGNVETVLLEANSQIGAEVVQQAAAVPPLAFAYLGESLYGIPINEATPATATATVTWAIDTPASMIPAESMLSVPHPSGESVVFTTDDDVAAIAGGGTVLVGITALEAGSQANGAFGTADLVELVEGVSSIVVAAATGGTDEEDELDYLDRLTEALTLLAPRPILPADFATLARQVPGVGRSTALDLYQPGTNDGPPGPIGTPLAGAVGVSNVARCVTVAITDESGRVPTATLMQNVYDELDARREVNFLTYVIAPKYTTIDVQATVRAFPGYDRADVEAAAEAMLASWLDPSVWGSQPTASGDAQQQWVVDTYVRLYEAVDWLNRAAGVNYVSVVQLRTGAAAYAAADVPLVAPAGLPLPGAINVTVKLPGEA